MAELVDIAGVWRGQLGPKMALLEQNYAEYARRASRVSAMVESYRKGLGGGQQVGGGLISWWPGIDLVRLINPIPELLAPLDGK